MKRKISFILIAIAAIILAIAISIVCYWFLPMSLGDFVDDGVEDEIAENRLSRYEFYKLVNQKDCDLNFEIRFNFEWFPHWVLPLTNIYKTYDDYLYAVQLYYIDQNQIFCEKYGLAENTGYCGYSVRTAEYSFSERLGDPLEFYLNELPKLAKAVADGNAAWARIFIPPIESELNIQENDSLSKQFTAEALAFSSIAESITGLDPINPLDQSALLPNHKDRSLVSLSIQTAPYRLMPKYKFATIGRKKP